MAAFFYNDVIGFCKSTPAQNLGDAIMGAPKGASNQLANVLYAGNRIPGITGSYAVNTFGPKFHIPLITIVVSG